MSTARYVIKWITSFGTTRNDYLSGRERWCGLGYQYRWGATSKTARRYALATAKRIAANWSPGTVKIVKVAS